jgi:hypothetical protein
VCRDQSIVALDPDIPPALQRPRFEVVAPTGSAWRRRLHRSISAWRLR